jgi:hypothetical protein
MDKVPNVSGIESMQHPSIGIDEVYEQQYHPKSELGDIFGRNDPIKKANLADDVIEEDDEEYDENRTPQQVIPTDGEYEGHTESKLNGSDGIPNLASTFGAPKSHRELTLKKPLSSIRVDEEN